MAGLLTTKTLDKSGGIIKVRYTNQIDTHRLSFHVEGFQTQESTGGAGGDAAVPNGDYPYNTPPAGGITDVGVADTFTRVVGLIAAGYDTTWTFTFDSLIQILNDQLVPIFPTPSPAGIVGAIPLGSAEVSAQRRYTEMIFNFRTTLGGRSRLILIAPELFNHTTGEGEYPPTVQAQTTAIISGVSGPNNRVEARDGGRLQPQANVTFPQNKRLRRKYGQS